MPGAPAMRHCDKSPVARDEHARLVAVGSAEVHGIERSVRNPHCRIAAWAITVEAIRLQLVRRGTRLGVRTVGYNSLEALIAIAAGVSAGSVALVAGADSTIEVTAASPGYGDSNGILTGQATVVTSGSGT